MKRILLFILMLLGIHICMLAQKGLAIQSAFDELAVRQNATEVVMGAGKLKKYHKDGQPDIPEFDAACTLDSYTAG